MFATLLIVLFTMTLLWLSGDAKPLLTAPDAARPPADRTRPNS